ncbi:MAG: FoF1 ATP synthase subunit a [Bacilli bacterium]
MNFENILNNNFIKMISPEFITSIIVMLIICIFSFVVYFKQKKYTALDEPKGIVNIMEFAIDTFDDQVRENMGVSYVHMSFYFMVLSAYIFLGFIVGMIGIPNFIYLGEDSIMNSSHLFASLTNPFTNIAFPLMIGLVTWIATQANSIRYSHWGYLKQFVSPIPLVGFLSLFSPLISITMRLFGNAFAGFCLSTIVYVALSQLFNGFGLLVSPVIMPFFHAYFDLFSGFIQTLIFMTLSMINIAQQGPDQEEQIAALSLKTTIAE